MMQPKPYPKDNKYLIYPDGRIWSDKTHKFLSLTKNKNGYLQVHLMIDGKKGLYSAHRLVAETFIPNPNNYPQVNHIDENKENNNYLNLEWVTRRQNCNYGTRNARLSENHKGSNNSTSKKVEMLDPKTQEVLKTFDSIGNACDYLQKTHGSGSISRACRGIYKTAYGYSWRFCD